jgi:hypothetical protein
VLLRRSCVAQGHRKQLSASGGADGRPPHQQPRSRPQPSPTSATKSARKRRSRMSAFAPLVEEERTSFNRVKNDANDPFRSSASKFYCNAQGDFPPCLGRAISHLTHVLHGSRCLEAVLGTGVDLGFGLLWSGYAGVTRGIKNTSQHRCIDDGSNDQRVGAAANGNLRDRQSVRG